MVPRVILVKPIQNGVLKSFNRSNLNIPQWIEIWFAPSGPDFYAISKMVHYIFVAQKLAKLLFKLSIFTYFR